MRLRRIFSILFLFLIALSEVLGATNRNIRAVTNTNGSAVFKFPTTTPTASRVCQFDSNGILESSSTIDTTELGYLNGVTSSLCGINQTCTLTGKTINGPDINFGTASDSIRLVLPKDTTTNLDGLTDTEGLLAFDTTQGLPVYNAGGGWTVIGSSSSAPNLVVQSKTTTYTALAADDLILASTSGGAWTLSLPTASGISGKVYRVKKTTSDVNALTIDPDSTETIDGDSTTTINTLGETLTIVSDGTNWQILERRIPSYQLGFIPTGSWTSNVTYLGFWKRDGDSMEVTVKINLSGAPNSTSLTINLPSGYSIDTNKLPTNFSEAGEILGIISMRDDGANIYQAVVGYSSTTSVSVRFLKDSTAAVSNNNAVNATAPFTWASGDRIGIRFKVPISGWKG